MLQTRPRHHAPKSKLWVDVAGGFGPGPLGLATTDRGRSSPRVLLDPGVSRSVRAKSGAKISR